MILYEGQCNGKITLAKRHVAEGIEDSCHKKGNAMCSNCNKYFCANHLHKHECKKENR